jgi:SAM-dependent methyltransferase
MKATLKPTVFDTHMSDYEAWFNDNQDTYHAELDAIRVHFTRLPENLRGIEVGLGTGRFALPLGIREGVEPSATMADKARKRGVEVMEASAEKLPYADMQFDFVLFVTVCHLENLEHAFREAKRVLKPGGLFIVGFLPEDRPVAQSYQERRKWSTFYKEAKFYSVKQISDLIADLGFKKPEFNQTLLGTLDQAQDQPIPVVGSDSGSFVVVSAHK